jgi:hypothetical protein
VPEADVRSEVREAMETVDCSVLRAVVRASTEALRSLASPMSTAHDATEDAENDDGAAAADGGGVDREGEDRRDRDTKLSRVWNPLTVGPRLRSS